MKKELPEKKKATSLDLFLLFLLVLSASALLFRWTTGESAKGEMQPLEITAVSAKIRGETADCLAVGEALYTAAGDYFGTVVQVERRLSKTELWSGGVLYTEVPEGSEIYDLSVIIETEGASGENGVFLQNGKLPLLVGEELLLYSRKTSLPFRIRSVVANSR